MSDEVKCCYSSEHVFFGNLGILVYVLSDIWGLASSE